MTWLRGQKEGQKLKKTWQRSMRRAQFVSFDLLVEGENTKSVDLQPSRTTGLLRRYRTDPSKTYSFSYHIDLSKDHS